jgi:hypothetical protein
MISNYMSVERLNNSKDFMEMTSGELFNIGSIVYSLLTGKLLFDDVDDEKI